MPRQDATRTAPCGKVLQARGYKLHVQQCKKCGEIGAAGNSGERPESSGDESPPARVPSTPPVAPAERPAGRPFRFGMGFKRG